jgi:hypothetical protein
MPEAWGEYACTAPGKDRPRNVTRLLVVSGTAPGDRRASAQRVEWLLRGLGEHGIETQLLVLHPTSHDSSIEIRQQDRMTIFNYPSESRPPYLKALLGRDGGFASTCTDTVTIARAVAEGKGIVDDFRPDLIVAVSRICTCEVAYQLSVQTGIPMMIDWHDPISLRPLATWRSRRYYRSLAERERLWVEHAKLHIMTAASHMKIFKDEYPRAATQLIPIGWDEIAGRNTSFVRPRTLLYSGSANGHAYGFTKAFPSLRGGRQLRRAVTGGRLYHAPFEDDIEYQPYGLNALAGVSGANGAATSMIFRGTHFNGTTGKKLRELSMMDKAEALPWISHHQAQSELPTAHVLWLTLAGIGNGKGEPVVACKAFSYLASGRPIVAVVPPQSETAGILRGHAGVWLPDPASIQEIKEAFQAALDTPAHVSFDRDVDDYRIDALTDDLLRAVERALGRRPSVRRTNGGHVLLGASVGSRHAVDPKVPKRA